MENEAQVPASILDAQVQRLLDIVKSYQQEQCDTLLGHARQESEVIIRQAYQLARSNIHENIALTRQHISDTMNAARAKQHTLVMQQRHTEALSFLDQCWQALQPALQASWQEPDTRHRWVAKIIAAASTVLPAGEWQVEHPADFSAADQQQLMDIARATADVTLQLGSASDITAGIRINADGASVDGSLQGLLADRSSLEALLLASKMGSEQRL